MLKTIRLSLIAFLFLLWSLPLIAQENNLMANKSVELSSSNWDIDDPDGGVFVKSIRRNSLYLYQGFAFLKDVELTDGIIEVDINTHGSRGFMGIMFRSEDKDNHELVYLRCHLSNAPDAVQYTPRFNGISGWQLYSGKGYIAEAEIQKNRWIHLKLEIKGKKALFYVNNASKPNLVITDLKRSIKKGRIGLWALNGPGHFSNFKYRKTKYPEENEVSKFKSNPVNFIENWQLSKVFKEGSISLDHINMNDLNWVDVKTDANGLLDIARYRKKVTNINRSPVKNKRDEVIARTIINAKSKKNIRLSFGYSDQIKIIVNGELLFEGNNSFRYRSPKFIGIVGAYETLILPFKKGKNEVLFIVKEWFGGWGFITKMEKR